MAIKNIIAKGIGFSPGTLKWIPTHGFGIGAPPVAVYDQTITAQSYSQTIPAQDRTNEILK